MRLLRPMHRSPCPRGEGCGLSGVGVTAAVLVLCLALGLLGGTRRWPGSAQAQGTQGEVTKCSQHPSEHFDAAPPRSVLWGATKGPSWSPPRLSLAHAEQSPWWAPSPGDRACQEAYETLVAVLVRRLSPGAAAHVGHASADQPPIITRPLRGPPAACVG